MACPANQPTGLTLRPCCLSSNVFVPPNRESGWAKGRMARSRGAQVLEDIWLRAELWMPSTEECLIDEISLGHIATLKVLK